jgi:hypothetical protein
VDKAGQALAANSATDADLDVINNWRSAHSFPLNTFQMNLRRKAGAVDPRSLIAQRLKRLTSIREKLGASTMKLSQMQGIGGCRAVVRSVALVHALRDLYVAADHSHVLVKDPTDYIAKPRTTGYRGVHLIYRYRSAMKGKEAFNNLLIEIQLRSQLQHAWATAVETVDVFTSQALKKNTGDERWLRFFALMGSAMARRERSPLVPSTPENGRELAQELQYLTNELDVVNVLASYHVALEMTDRIPASDGYVFFLLELRPTVGRTVVTRYTRAELDRATAAYLDAERAAGTEPGSQAVLVSVESLAALKRAYPNYFLDTRRFIYALKFATRG